MRALTTLATLLLVQTVVFRASAVKALGRRICTIAIIATGFAGLSFPTTATPIFYLTEASFVTAAADAGIALSIESFEFSVVDLGSTVTYPDGSFVCEGGICGLDTIDNSTRRSTDGTNSLSWFPEDGFVTFNFLTETNAFGIDVIDGFEFSPFLLTLTANGGSNVYSSAPDQSETLLNLTFIGVIDTMQTFSSAVISDVTSGDFHLFDRLQTADAIAISEPTTLTLFATGLAGLGFMMRRRRST